MKWNNCWYNFEIEKYVTQWHYEIIMEKKEWVYKLQFILFFSNTDW